MKYIREDGGRGGGGVEKLIRRKSLTCAAVVDATERGVQDDRGRAPLRLLQLRAYRPRLGRQPAESVLSARVAHRQGRVRAEDGGVVEGCGRGGLGAEGEPASAAGYTATGHGAGH